MQPSRPATLPISAGNASLRGLPAPCGLSSGPVSLFIFSPHDSKEQTVVRMTKRWNNFFFIKGSMNTRTNIRLFEGLCSLRCAFPREARDCARQRSCLRIPSNACRWGPCKEWAMEATSVSSWRFFCERLPLGKLAFQMAAAHRKSRLAPASIVILCGEGGIRTPGTLPFNSFQDCRNRPLYHLSSAMLCMRVQI